VFDGASPKMAGVLLLAREELHDWGLTRARGISYIFALVPDGE